MSVLVSSSYAETGTENPTEGSQQKKITGTVNDNTCKPIPGETFFVKYFNIEKASADVSRLILIDSWKNWSCNGQIEPPTQCKDRYLKILLYSLR